MGSRAVIVVCKDELVAEKRFGVTGEGIGVCYTRTGRNFFNDETLAKSFLKRVREALTKAGTWEKFSTDWICLDAELMPWSAKAQSLLKDQYAAVAAAAEPALTAVNEALVKAATRNVEGLDNVLAKFTHKRESIDKFRTAYRHYCWPVTSLADYKLAPFHILATEGEVHADKDHQWHMDNIHAVCDADEQLFRKTPYHVIDTESKESRQSAIDWWLELTRAGGEGMVVKPLDFTAFGKGGLLQPAVKCRGSEYLRIIYGPEYDAADNLKLLKKRGLSRKRSLALREFALGIEALERFVRQEPLRRIHESVFGVLALESEEVDPRL